jgi:hypothetical protein
MKEKIFRHIAISLLIISAIFSAAILLATLGNGNRFVMLWMIGFPVTYWLTILALSTYILAIGITRSNVATVNIYILVLSILLGNQLLLKSSVSDNLGLIVILSIIAVSAAIFFSQHKHLLIKIIITSAIAIGAWFYEQNIYVIPTCIFLFSSALVGLLKNNKLRH